jgi:hypothetical protein
VKCGAAPHNKELKLTKPSMMELRSLTPVLGGPAAGATMIATDGAWAGALLSVVVACCASLAACEGHVSKEAAANIERSHKMALLPGWK